MFSVALFLLQKTEKRSASRKLVKYWHTNEEKKSTKQFKCEDCVEVGGKKRFMAVKMLTIKLCIIIT